MKPKEEANVAVLFSGSSKASASVFFKYTSQNFPFRFSASMPSSRARMSRATKRRHRFQSFPSLISYSRTPEPRRFTLTFLLRRARFPDLERT